MSRRILSVAVTVLGLVLVALAVCSATIWKPSSKVEAKLASGPSQPYVMTAPGVLSGTESDIAVTAKSSDGKDVHLFIARAADVDAWLSPDADNALPYTAVTGIDADAGTLSSKDETQYCPPANATPAPSPSAAASSQPSAQPSASAQAGSSQCSARKASAVNASGSDLWLGEKTGGSSVTFNTAESADRAILPRKTVDEQIVVMAMTDGKAAAPSLTISWSRQVETPWYFYGGLVLGGLFVLAGAFLFFIDLQLRRADVERRTLSAERAARIANADSVSTEGIPQVTDPDRRLTRRGRRSVLRPPARPGPTRALVVSTSTASRLLRCPKRLTCLLTPATQRASAANQAVESEMPTVRAASARRAWRTRGSPGAHQLFPVLMRPPLSSTVPPVSRRASRVVRLWRSSRILSTQPVSRDSPEGRSSPRLPLTPAT